MSGKKGFSGRLAGLILIFGIVRIAIFTSYHMVSPFMPEIARSLNTTIIVIGAVISLRSALGFLGPVWGSITDFAGPKRGVMAGLSVFALSMLAIYLIPSLGCFWIALPLSYGAILVFDAGMYAYLSDHVPYENRGRMVAILEASYALAFMLGSPVAGVLIGRFGWSVPFLFMAVIAVVFVFVIGIALPKDVKVEKTNGNNEKYSAQIKKVIKDKPAMMALLTCILLMGGNWFVQSLYGVWLEDTYSRSIEQIGFISSAFGFAVFAGAMLCLVFTDKLGKTKAMLIAASITAAAGVGAIVFNSSSLVVAALFLFVYFCCIEFATESCIALMTEVRDDIRGTVVATSFGCLAIGSSIACGIAPSLYEKYGYTICIGIGVVILLAAILVIVKVLNPHFSKAESR